MENYLVEISEWFQNEITYSVLRDCWNFILGFSWHFFDLLYSYSHKVAHKPIFPYFSSSVQSVAHTSTAT